MNEQTSGTFLPHEKDAYNKDKLIAELEAELSKVIKLSDEATKGYHDEWTRHKARIAELESELQQARQESREIEESFEKYRDVAVANQHLLESKLQEAESALDEACFCLCTHALPPKEGRTRQAAIAQIHAAKKAISARGGK